MFDPVEIPVTARITLPEAWVECDPDGRYFLRSQSIDGHSVSFMEEIPAEIGRDGMNALLGRLRDFLTRNAKVELLQG